MESYESVVDYCESLEIVCENPYTHEPMEDLIWEDYYRDYSE